MSTSLKVLTIGGSRNIGYFSSLRLLAAGATVTFLLRNPACFNDDADIKQYVASNHVMLVKGDALVKTDIERAFAEAAKDRPIDVVLFTVGGIPKFSLTKGFIIDPPNLVTQSLLNVLASLPTPHPRLITLSSTGLTKTSHDALPLAMKPLYGYLLAVPHKDKVGAERAVAHSAGWTWNSAVDGEPDEDIMGGDFAAWSSKIPAPGTLKNVLVIRPALLTDGESKGDAYKFSNEEGRGGSGVYKEPYRVSTAELGGWTVSRKDVSHFVAEAILKRWSEYEGKVVNISY